MNGSQQSMNTLTKVAKKMKLRNVMTISHKIFLNTKKANHN